MSSFMEGGNLVTKTNGDNNGQGTTVHLSLQDKGGSLSTSCQRIGQCTLWTQTQLTRGLLHMRRSSSSD
jgi:hypothetical protein